MIGSAYMQGRKQSEFGLRLPPGNHRLCNALDIPVRGLRVWGGVLQMPLISGFAVCYVAAANDSKKPRGPIPNSPITHFRIMR